MGRDKARLQLRGRSMLSIVRATAKETGHRVRVIRHDLVPRCGPLGGILTGLKSTRAGAVLFLACDMPLITAALLHKLMRASGANRKAVFSSQGGRLGFPLLLPARAADPVQKQIAAKNLSVQQLAVKLRVRKLRIGPRAASQLFNVNTPEEACVAECHLDFMTEVRSEAAKLQLRTDSPRD